MISSSLFHFTDFDSLKKILISKSFLPGYNFEDVSDLGYSKKYLAIPMVCFCDIPLKFTDEHTGEYKPYAIGLTKEWGVQQRINPVLYRTPDSYYANSIKKLNKLSIGIQGAITSFVIHNQKEDSKRKGFTEMDRIVEMAISLFEETKTSSIFSKPQDYYKEREWRYLDKSGAQNFYKKKNESYKEKLTSEYRKQCDGLSFSFEDIKHIVVKDQESLKEMLSLLQSEEAFEKNKISLAQRLIDLETIKNDM